MQTLLTTSSAAAAKVIKRGGIVAFPTETVFGLGASVFDEAAIAKIFEAKNRPNDNPLIAHVGSLEQINLLAYEINKNAKKFIDAFFPSALTLVLKKRENVPLIATANLDTIGVRMPKHVVAQEFLKACDTPVVAPSANISGKPSPTTWQAVFEDLNGKIDCILQGEQTIYGLESTVVDCTSETPIVLRLGAITLEQLREIVPETTFRLGGEGIARSPGLKHKHYSPDARVILIQGGKIPFAVAKNSAFIGINLPDVEFNLVRKCESAEDYAHEVFAFFRECDQKHIGTIYCETVSEKGIGAALMDRLERASQG